MPTDRLQMSLKGSTRDNRITNDLVRKGKLPRSQAELYPQLSSQQIRAIKDSPKGKLPKFLSTYSYKGKSESGRNVDIKSVGGRVGKVGGTLGYDKVSKKPFGSVNYKGKVKARFGDQD